jgi:hypothetical protein
MHCLFCTLIEILCNLLMIFIKLCQFFLNNPSYTVYSSIVIITHLYSWQLRVEGLLRFSQIHYWKNWSCWLECWVCVCKCFAQIVERNYRHLWQCCDVVSRTASSKISNKTQWNSLRLGDWNVYCGRTVVRPCLVRSTEWRVQPRARHVGRKCSRPSTAKQMNCWRLTQTPGKKSN